MRIELRLVLLIAMWVAATPAFAQPGADRAGADRAGAERAGDRRDKIKQRIRALRAYTLTEQLELDEATAAKLFPALAKYDEEFDKLLLARTDLQRRLETAHELKDAKTVDKLIDDAVANQKALWDTEDKRLSQLRKILTPAQTARLLVVLPAMERKIQNQLRRAVKQPAQRGAPREFDGAYDPRDESALERPFEDTPRGRRAQPTHKGPPAGGDFVDPFDTSRRAQPRKQAGSGDSVVDPFSRSGPEPVKPPAAPTKKKCDPFGSMTGCRAGER